MMKTHHGDINKSVVKQKKALDSIIKALFPFRRFYLLNPSSRRRYNLTLAIKVIGVNIGVNRSDCRVKSVINIYVTK